MRLFLLFLLAISLNAEILDSKQLFNKKIIKVKEEAIETKKIFYGELRVDESLVSDVVLRFDGFVEDLFVDKTFSYVKKGEPLFSVYSDAVVNAQEEYIFAKKNNQRKSIIDSAFSKLTALDIHKKELREIYKTLNVKENINIYAPTNGYVKVKNINSGSFAKKGKVLFQIEDYSKLWVIAKVYQQDLWFVKVGAKTKVKVDGFGEVLGVVDYIYPTVDTKGKTVDIRVVIDNKNLTYLPKLFAKVAIYSPQKTMLTLPKSAVLTKGDKHYVFKPAGKSDYEPIEVTAKRVSSSKYEILDGVDVGEGVIDRVLFMLDSDAVTNGLYETEEDEDW